MRVCNWLKLVMDKKSHAAAGSSGCALCYPRETWRDMSSNRSVRNWKENERLPLRSRMCGRQEVVWEGRGKGKEGNRADERE